MNGTPSDNPYLPESQPNPNTTRPSIRIFSVNITYVANYVESGKGVEKEDGRTIMDREINIQPEEY